MVVYLSQQTSEALVESGREAKSLSMMITYTDGEVSLTRAGMTHPTDEADQIAQAAIALLRQVPLRVAALASIRLAVTTVESPRKAPTTHPESAQKLGHRLSRRRHARIESRQPFSLQSLVYKGFGLSHLSDQADTKALQELHPEQAELHTHNDESANSRSVAGCRLRRCNSR
jgi:hypothetical protein